MKPRHSRQGRLTEVGEEGQRRIARATPVVRGDGLAARVEARYLAGAGVERIVVEDEGVARAATDIDALVQVRVAQRDGDGDRDGEPRWASDLMPPSRDVALGAYRALEVIRRAVEEAS